MPVNNLLITRIINVEESSFSSKDNVVFITELSQSLFWPTFSSLHRDDPDPKSKTYRYPFIYRDKKNRRSSFLIQFYLRDIFAAAIASVQLAVQDVRYQLSHLLDDKGVSKVSLVADTTGNFSFMIMPLSYLQSSAFQVRGTWNTQFVPKSIKVYSPTTHEHNSLLFKNRNQ